MRKKKTNGWTGKWISAPNNFVPTVSECVNTPTGSVLRLAKPSNHFISLIINRGMVFIRETTPHHIYPQGSEDSTDIMRKRKCIVVERIVSTSWAYSLQKERRVEASSFTFPPRRHKNKPRLQVYSPSNRLQSIWKSACSCSNRSLTGEFLTLWTPIGERLLQIPNIHTAPFIKGKLIRLRDCARNRSILLWRN